MIEYEIIIKPHREEAAPLKPTKYSVDKQCSDLNCWICYGDKSDKLKKLAELYGMGQNKLSNMLDGDIPF